MKIPCPHCKGLWFEEWHVYAKHIIKEHPSDKQRVAWAKHCLEDLKRGRLVEVVENRKSL